MTDRSVTTLTVIAAMSV